MARLADTKPRCHVCGEGVYEVADVLETDILNIGRGIWMYGLRWCGERHHLVHVSDKRGCLVTFNSATSLACDAGQTCPYCKVRP